MIVALLNQQHGVGKTTLALHLAGVWRCQSQRVTVIDADPQGCALGGPRSRCRGASPSLVSHATPFTARRRISLVTSIA
jgi:chromosome partitioning protein